MESWTHDVSMNLIHGINFEVILKFGTIRPFCETFRI